MTEQEQLDLEFLRDRYNRLVRIVSPEWLAEHEGRGWGIHLHREPRVARKKED